MALPSRLPLTLLAAALAAGPLAAQALRPGDDRDAPGRVQGLGREALARLQDRRAELGLDEDHAFALRSVQGDELGQVHARVQQRYRGLRVWGGEAIAHLDAGGRELPLTSDLKAGIYLNTRPSLEPAEVLGRVHQDLAPKGPYASEPTVELVVLPLHAAVRKPGRRALLDAELNADDLQVQVVRHALAYHVHTALENGLETRHTDYLVDAHTGAILRKWDDLHTASATGTGKSQYSGTVNLTTNSVSGGYELRDTARSMNIATYNLNHGTSGQGTIYTDADNTWGDGSNYVEGSSTTAANGQTAAVDAHYGAEISFDFFKNLLGRNGIDGNGRATYSRVHYSNSYDNAFWDDGCFCMTYGDGSQFTTLTALDVAGHEMSHGVCSNTAGLVYSGESGGLNESNSDIHGNMIELFSKNGGSLPATVANTDGCWTLGEQMGSTPLRYMYKPSKDGNSPDAWSSGTGNLDVHFSSGPNNRMFFFLSQGASATSGSDTYTSYLPSGMVGIGPEKAVRIWYRALATYMTSGTSYSGARSACISAAKDLYGAGGAEEAAVWNAYHGINVGAAWSGSTGVSVSVAPATASVTAGGTFQFSASVSGSSNTAVAWSVVESGGGAVSASGLYTAPTAPGTYHVKATSQADATKAAQATVTVTAAGVSVTVSPATATVAPGASFQFSASVSGSSNTAVAWSVVESGGGAVSGSGLYTAPSAPGTYHVKATSQADATKSAQATVTVATTSGNELLVNGGFESGATGWGGTTTSIGDWSAYGHAAAEGTKSSWLGGYGQTVTETLSQTVAIPATAPGATLTFQLRITTSESPAAAYDKLTVQVRRASGTVLRTLATYSNLDAGPGYAQRSFDLSAYRGQTVQIYFRMVEDAYVPTSFDLDKVSLK